MKVIAYLSIAACLLASAGCRQGRSPGDSPANDHDEEHVGHVIPAHKPKSFPDAVRALRELNDRIGRGAVDAKTLSVALDVANWLPEIAADSDMPEGPWDEVDACSKVLVAGFQEIKPGASGPASASTGANAAAISRLQ